MNSSDNNFTIKDNSQILSILPKEWAIPLIIISKVKGYDSVDNYVLQMIRDRLNMYLDTRDELGEDFQKYMKDIGGLEGLSTEEDEEDGESKSNKEKDYVNVQINSDLVDRLVKVEEKKKQQQTTSPKSEFVKDVHENYHDMKHTDDKENEDLK